MTCPTTSTKHSSPLYAITFWVQAPSCSRRAGTADVMRSSSVLHPNFQAMRPLLPASLLYRPSTPVIRSPHARTQSSAAYSRVNTPGLPISSRAKSLSTILCSRIRKKPADDAVSKENALVELGLKTAHLLGIEQTRDWLTLYPKIWIDLGYDRFETPLRHTNRRSHSSCLCVP